MTQISSAAAYRLLDSVAFLNDHHGLALNSMLTLNFEQLGVPERAEGKDALTAMNQFLARKICRFAEKHGGMREHFYVYAHERCSGHGWHVHQLMVTPSVLRTDVQVWLRTWQQRNFPSAHPQAIHFTRGGGRTLDQIAAVQARMLRYILKTLAPAISRDREGQPARLSDLLALKRQEASLPLHVPRLAGASQNLTAREQIKAGYQPPQFWEDLLTDKQLCNHRWRVHAKELRGQLLAHEI